MKNSKASSVVCAFRPTFVKWFVSGFIRTLVNRFVALTLATAQIAFAMPLDVLAQATRKSDPATSPSPRKIVANRKVPLVRPPDLTVHFGDEPSTIELMRARVLPEPMRPTSSPSLSDNRAVAQALESYAGVGITNGGVDQLEAFVTSHRSSPWRATLLANLGTIRQDEGYVLSRSSILGGSLGMARYGTDGYSRAVADYAIGERLKQAALFGQEPVLTTRLKELEGRTVRGTAVNRVTSAREALWFLTHAHDQAILSGPEALKAIVRERHPSDTKALGMITGYHPPHEGTSLSELRDLGQRAGLDLEMRFVASVEDVPVFSVVHLKSDHYAMLLARRDNGYVLKDSALGGGLFMSKAALQDEASGYVLLPVTPSQPIGRTVTVDEGQAVFGHCTPGEPFNNEPCIGCWNLPASGPPPPPPPPPGCGAGMPMYRLHPLTAAVLVSDMPLSCTPPRGPSTSFRLRYNQRANWLGQTPDFSHLGPGWRHDWISYVVDNNSSVSPPYTWINVLLRGEGTGQYNSYTGSTHWKTRATLVEVSHDPARYERTLADGTVEVYAFPDRGPSVANRRVFLTELIDPQGQSLTFTYDENIRLVAVTDAIGQVTTLDYDDEVDPLRITSVTDPFERTASMTYDSAGRLQSITDVIGMTSRFAFTR